MGCQLPICEIVRKVSLLPPCSFATVTTANKKDVTQLPFLDGIKHLEEGTNARFTRATAIAKASEPGGLQQTHRRRRSKHCLAPKPDEVLGPFSRGVLGRKARELLGALDDRAKIVVPDVLHPLDTCLTCGRKRVRRFSGRYRSSPF